MNLKNENGVVYLTPEIARFMSCGDFLGLELNGDFSLLNESELDVPRRAHYDRVRLRRAFPFSLEERYISVLDTDQNEIGLIEDTAIFPESDRELIKKELERVYYFPRILSVKSIRERLGYAYLDALSDAGEIEIPLKDVQKSIVHVGADKLVITDTDGNRYLIESFNELDKKSRKKLEAYV